MRFPTSRLRPPVGGLTAALVLTACGSGGRDDGDDKATSKDSPPSNADFKEAQTALTDLKADYEAVYDAVDEFEKLDALEDPDVAKAYETFSAKAEEGDQFHDSLFAEFPLLKQVLIDCGDVYPSTNLETSPSSPTDFGRRLLAQYRPAIADCLPTLEKLSTSENATLAVFGSGFSNIVTQRRTLMTQLSTGDLALPAFDTQFEDVTTRMADRAVRTVQGSIEEALAVALRRSATAQRIPS